MKRKRTAVPEVTIGAQGGDVVLTVVVGRRRHSRRFGDLTLATAVSRAYEAAAEQRRAAKPRIIAPA